MQSIVGQVIEVYIPEQYKNGRLLDVMDRTNIGFKVETKEGIKEQNDLNVTIMKDDKVEIIKQNISGKEFIDIDIYSGDEDE